MLTLTDIQLELNDRAGVEATGIRLTRQEFDDLVRSRGRPSDPLIQPERSGKPAQVMGMPVTWVARSAGPRLLPAVKPSRGR
ncbi:hypothetical protein [Phenylobacterium sp. SCN 70-31]|uniref:hypothetical protein n=1 Tax=Phenylobacterium sp. SCN 70-31 TaxID=1660129 RepID=UPI00086CFBD2|nr:hypothetical protein [Phenylobacterium sp. SCN 70-31]ODT89079.1 MAG: hypothetical protein ABS78_02450 [Phenylobacterium sp. SCN 70-31]